MAAWRGEMAEWFKAHAWKACVLKRYREFESPSLRQLLLVVLGGLFDFLFAALGNVPKGAAS
jgi:hypothetical protein